MSKNTRTEEMITGFRSRWGDRFDYSDTIYIPKRINIRCRSHGIFYVEKPTHHMRYKHAGCRLCANEAISSVKQWTIEQFIEKAYREWRIPTTRYRADGYAANTNTIYEFLGDFWHGNLLRYPPNDLNNVTKTTFLSLHEKTLKRNEKIRSLGFNLVTMWETDWNNNKQPNISYADPLFPRISIIGK